MLLRPRLLSRSEEARLVDAIRRAERDNRGEVRVHVERRCKGDPLERARELFGSMCAGETSGDTGVLLYVAVASRRAAVWAGRGVHATAGPDFWQGAIDAVADGYRAGDGTRGIEAAIDEIGELLRRHLPGADTAGNELPDKVTTS